MIQQFNVIQLENVAITNALQLEATQVTPALSCFNYDGMPSLTYSLLYESIFVADILIYAVTLTLHL